MTLFPCDQHLLYALCISGVFTLHAVGAQATASAPSDADPELVARHAITLNAPAGEPTQFMPRGPLLGNGDVGVMQSGPAEELIFYIGKNDFWTLKHQFVIAVGQLLLLTPALQAAQFKTDSDMHLAELRGTYTKSDATMTSRAWVDANHNVLCVGLTNTGSSPLAITPAVFVGAATAAPASIRS